MNQSYHLVFLGLYLLSFLALLSGVRRLVSLNEIILHTMGELTTKITENMKKAFIKFLPMNKILHSEFWQGAITAAIGWTIAFVVPISHFLIFTMVLVFCDLYIGTKAAKKRGEEIHDRGIERTSEKLIVHFMVILLMQGLIQTFKLWDGITYVVALYIAIKELRSILKNVKTINGLDVWSVISEYVNLKKYLPKEKDEEK